MKPGIVHRFHRHFEDDLLNADCVRFWNVRDL